MFVPNWSVGTLTNRVWILLPKSREGSVVHSVCLAKSRNCIVMNGQMRTEEYDILEANLQGQRWPEIPIDPQVQEASSNPCVNSPVKPSAKPPAKSAVDHSAKPPAKPPVDPTVEAPAKLPAKVPAC